MKLLDLETGKYLELGKDWLYGGNAIHIICQDYVEDMKYFDDEVIINDYIHGNAGCDGDLIQANIYLEEKTEPQEPLKTPCEVNGAVMYGSRYILFEPGECDDYNSIFEEYSKSLRGEENELNKLMELFK